MKLLVPDWRSDSPYMWKLLAPDRRSDCKYDTFTSARSAKTAKHQLRNKAVEVVENATGYKCAISPATNDLNVIFNFSCFYLGFYMILYDFKVILTINSETVRKNIVQCY